MFLWIIPERKIKDITKNCEKTNLNSNKKSTEIDVNWTQAVHY